MGQMAATAGSGDSELAVGGVSRLPQRDSQQPAAKFSRRPRLWSLAPDPQRLGEGAFGSVYRGSLRGQPVAVKKLVAKRRGAEADASVRRELECSQQLLQLRHPNVVRYFEFDSSQPPALFVVMEMVDGDTLASLRTRDGELASSRRLRPLVHQVCLGLQYLHAQSPAIVHRDLKGANIMLTRAEAVVKLVDFGLAVACDGGEATRRSLCGTFRFMAPEVWREQLYSGKSDVFALGCTLHELVQGRPPHWDKTNELRICYAFLHSEMPQLGSGDSRLCDFYCVCTRQLPQDRPTAEQLQSHPFLSNGC